jgi:hypothetical protein
LIGFTEEVNTCNGRTAVVVPCPDTLEFLVIGNNDAPTPDGGINKAMIFSNEIISVTDGIITDSFLAG